MPTLTIYLNNELYDKVKNSPSRIVRAALEKYFDNKTQEAEPTEQKNQEWTGDLWSITCACCSDFSRNLQASGEYQTSSDFQQSIEPPLRLLNPTSIIVYCITKLAR